jgi:two-component system, NtrC family, nitrogen regulation response regulator GlnG
MALAELGRSMPLDAGGTPDCWKKRCRNLSSTLIRVAMRAWSGGRRQDAARLLGWGRNTLARKIRELGLDDL